MLIVVVAGERACLHFWLAFRTHHLALLMRPRRWALSRWASVVRRGIQAVDGRGGAAHHRFSLAHIHLEACLCEQVNEEVEGLLDSSRVGATDVAVIGVKIC